MTSTNDEKDVKSYQTSCQKDKSYYIGLYKSLDGALNKSESPLQSRCAALCEAWRRVHTLCAHSAPTTQNHLITWIQTHTARTVLQTEWQDPNSKDEHEKLEQAIGEFLSETHEAIAARQQQLGWEYTLLGRAGRLKTLLLKPWDHPVLKVLLDPSAEQPDTLKLIEWLKEECGVVFGARLRQLAMSKNCSDLALLLVTAVTSRVRAAAAPVCDTDLIYDKVTHPDEGDQSFKLTLVREAGFERDIWDLLIDLEFVLLHKSDNARLIELAKQTRLTSGYPVADRLLKRLALAPREKKIWKNAKDVATLIAQVMITRCMVVPWCAGLVRSSLYWCARALVRGLAVPRLPKACAALAAPAATARHLHTFARAVHAEQSLASEELKAFVVELYVRAITFGMNELEKLKLKPEKEKEARATEQTLAGWFLQLGQLLAGSARMQCECILTAFSVHPAPEMYAHIHTAPSLPAVEIPEIKKDESEINPEFGSWANDSRSMTNFVKTSETLNLKQSQHHANVLSTAILTEGETLGLEAELCQDIAVLLSGPRVKTLSWDMDRCALLENCRTYMERTHGGTRALTTELKYLNLDPKNFQHLPEENDDEDDIYYGIEKGYEHHMELEPQPEEIWEDALNDPERTDSCHTDSEESGTRRKKKNKQLEHSDESDCDPLSMVAETKRTEKKKKERPHSKERSKNKKKPKDEKRKQRKEKKERKKKDKSNNPLSNLIGLKVTKSNEFVARVSEEDGQKSDGNVVYDGQFSMDELKSPEAPVKNNPTPKEQMTCVLAAQRIQALTGLKKQQAVGTPPLITDEVKRGIVKLINFRRQKAADASLTNSPLSSPSQSPKPEIGTPSPGSNMTAFIGAKIQNKLKFDPKQSEKLKVMKNEANNFLTTKASVIYYPKNANTGSKEASKAAPFNVPAKKPNPPTSASTPSTSNAQQMHSPSAKSTHLSSYQEFLKQLQMNANAGLRSPSPPPEAERKQTESASRVTAAPDTQKELSPLSAKPVVLQKKVENAPNTFARLSYMHKNKQNEKPKPIESNLQNSVSEELDRRIDELRKAKMICINSAANRRAGNAAYTTKQDNKFENFRYEGPKVEVQSIDNLKTLSIAAENHQLLASLLSGNSLSVKKCSEPTSAQTLKSLTAAKTNNLTEKDQQDLRNLLGQKNKLNEPTQQKPFQSIRVGIPSTDELRNSNIANPMPVLKVPVAVSEPTKIIPDVKTQFQFDGKPFQLPVISNSTIMKTTELIQKKKPRTKMTLYKSDRQNFPKKMLDEVDKTALEANKVATAKKYAPKPPVVTPQVKDDKPDQDWTKVLDALRSQKTHSRGPNALDLVLNKNAFNKTTEGQSFHQKIYATKEQVNKIVKTHNTIIKAVPDKPSTSVAPNIIQNVPILKKIDAKKEPSLKAVRRKTSLTIYPRDNKSNPTTMAQQMLAKVEDPFISGIRNSDYEILEELMDDDLRKEIGELSSDDDSYRSPTVPCKTKIATNTKNISVAKSNTEVQRTTEVINPKALFDMQLTAHASTPNATLSKPKAKPRIISNEKVDIHNINCASNSNRKSQKVALLNNNTVNAHVQRTANASVNVANTHVQRTINSHVQGTVNSHVQSTVNTHVQRSVNTHVQSTFNTCQNTGNTSCQNTVNTYVQNTVNTYVQNTVHALVQNDVDSMLYNALDPQVQTMVVFDPYTGMYDLNHSYIQLGNTGISDQQYTSIVNPVIINNTVSTTVHIPTVVSSNIPYLTCLELPSEVPTLTQIPTLAPIKQPEITNTNPEANKQVAIRKGPQISKPQGIDTPAEPKPTNKVCERKVLSEVQEKLKFTKTASENVKGNIDLERLAKKRLAIRNRDIHHRCFYPPIPLSYTPLRMERPKLMHEKVVSVKAEDTKLCAKTPQKDADVNGTENTKENKNVSCRSILLRSSGKLKAKDVGAMTRENPVGRKTKVRLKHADAITTNIEKNKTVKKPKAADNLEKQGTKGTNEKQAKMKAKKVPAVKKVRVSKRILNKKVKTYEESEENDRTIVQPSEQLAENKGILLEGVSVNSHPIHPLLDIEDAIQGAKILKINNNTNEEETERKKKIVKKTFQGSFKTVTEQNIEKEELESKESKTKPAISFDDFETVDVVEILSSPEICETDPLTELAPKILGTDQQLTNFNQAENILEGADLIKAKPNENVKETSEIITTDPSIAVAPEVSVNSKTLDIESKTIKSSTGEVPRLVPELNEDEIKNVAVNQTSLASKSPLKNIETQNKLCKLVNDMETVINAIAESTINSPFPEKELSGLDSEGEAAENNNLSRLTGGSNIVEEKRVNSVETTITDKSVSNLRQEQGKNDEIIGIEHNSDDSIDIISTTMNEKNQNTVETTAAKIIDVVDTNSKKVSPKTSEKSKISIQDTAKTNDANLVENSTISNNVKIKEVFETDLQPIAAKISTQEHEKKDKPQQEENSTKALPIVGLTDATKHTEKSRDQVVLPKDNQNLAKPIEVQNTSAEDVPQYLKDSIKIEEIHNPLNLDPNQKTLRLILPDNKVYKVTIHGKMQVGFDTLFEDPRLKTILLSSFGNRKRYILNVHQISTHDNKILDTYIKEVEFETNDNTCRNKVINNINSEPVETVNLISDDEDEISNTDSAKEKQPVTQTLTTASGTYKVKTMEQNLLENHQSRLSMKLCIPVQRCDAKPKTRDLINALLEDINDTLTAVDQSDLIAKTDVIEINDSSDEGESEVNKSDDKIGELKNLLLKELGVDSILDGTPIQPTKENTSLDYDLVEKRPTSRTKLSNEKNTEKKSTKEGSVDLNDRKQVSNIISKNCSVKLVRCDHMSPNKLDNECKTIEDDDVADCGDDDDVPVSTLLRSGSFSILNSIDDTDILERSSSPIIDVSETLKVLGEVSRSCSNSPVMEVYDIIASLNKSQEIPKYSSPNINDSRVMCESDWLATKCSLHLEQVAINNYETESGYAKNKLNVSDCQTEASVIKDSLKETSHERNKLEIRSLMSITLKYFENNPPNTTSFTANKVALKETVELETTDVKNSNVPSLTTIMSKFFEDSSVLNQLTYIVSRVNIPEHTPNALKRKLRDQVDYNIKLKSPCKNSDNVLTNGSKNDKHINLENNINDIEHTSRISSWDKDTHLVENVTIFPIAKMTETEEPKLEKTAYTEKDCDLQILHNTEPALTDKLDITEIITSEGSFIEDLSSSSLTESERVAKEVVSYILNQLSNSSFPTIANEDYDNVSTTLNECTLISESTTENNAYNYTLPNINSKEDVIPGDGIITADNYASDNKPIENISEISIMDKQFNKSDLVAEDNLEPTSDEHKENVMEHVSEMSVIVKQFNESNLVAEDNFESTSDEHKENVMEHVSEMSVMVKQFNESNLVAEDNIESTSDEHQENVMEHVSEMSVIVKQFNESNLVAEDDLEPTSDEHKENVMEHVSEMSVMVKQFNESNLVAADNIESTSDEHKENVMEHVSEMSVMDKQFNESNLVAEDNNESTSDKHKENLMEHVSEMSVMDKQFNESNPVAEDNYESTSDEHKENVMEHVSEMSVMDKQIRIESDLNLAEDIFEPTCVENSVQTNEEATSMVAITGTSKAEETSYNDNFTELNAIDPAGDGNTLLITKEATLIATETKISEAQETSYKNKDSRSNDRNVTAEGINVEDHENSKEMSIIDAKNTGEDIEYHQTSPVVTKSNDQDVTSEAIITQDKVPEISLDKANQMSNENESPMLIELSDSETAAEIDTKSTSISSNTDKEDNTFNRNNEIDAAMEIVLQENIPSVSTVETEQIKIDSEFQERFVENFTSKFEEQNAPVTVPELRVAKGVSIINEDESATAQFLSKSMCIDNLVPEPQNMVPGVETVDTNQITDESTLPETNLEVDENKITFEIPEMSSRVIENRKTSVTNEVQEQVLEPLNKHNEEIHKEIKSPSITEEVDGNIKSITSNFQQINGISDCKELIAAGSVQFLNIDVNVVAVDEISKERNKVELESNSYHGGEFNYKEDKEIIEIYNKQINNEEKTLIEERIETVKRIEDVPEKTALNIEETEHDTKKSEDVTFLEKEHMDAPEVDCNVNELHSPTANQNAHISLDVGANAENGIKLGLEDHKVIEDFKFSSDNIGIQDADKNVPECEDDKENETQEVTLDRSKTDDIPRQISSEIANAQEIIQGEHCYISTAFEHEIRTTVIDYTKTQDGVPYQSELIENTVDENVCTEECFEIPDNISTVDDNPQCFENVLSNDIVDWVDHETVVGSEISDSDKSSEDIHVSLVKNQAQRYKVLEDKTVDSKQVQTDLESDVKTELNIDNDESRLSSPSYINAQSDISIGSDELRFDTIDSKEIRYDLKTEVLVEEVQSQSDEESTQILYQLNSDAKSDCNNKGIYVEKSIQEVEYDENILEKNASLVYKDDSGVILKGIEYEDPEIGPCYVFPLIKSSDESGASEVFNNSTGSTIEVIPNLSINSDIAQDTSSELEEYDEDFTVIVPKFTYSKRSLKRKSDMKDIDYNEKRPRRTSRSRDYSEARMTERRYRKSKNIDTCKLTTAAIAESNYRKEYKQILDYISSIEFSYAVSYSNEYVDVPDLVRNWPIKGQIPKECQVKVEVCNTLFVDIENDNDKYLRDPLKLTLEEELTARYNDDDFSNNSNTDETNFSMGFGEGSGRVIQNLNGGAISNFSAATLSDVKQSQPLLLSEDDSKNYFHENTILSQLETVKRFFANIQLRDKISSFFKKTTIELSRDMNKDKDSFYNRDASFPFEKYYPICPAARPLETIVHVVQVGQLPVSAAAQNPVTCDPRVTQVSDASPSQCSAENSPNDDSQQGIKTEYTELTTADLSLPLVEEYVQRTHQSEESNNVSLSGENIPIQSEFVKTEVKIELEEETPDERDTSVIESSDQADPNKHVNNVDYMYDTNNTEASMESDYQTLFGSTKPDSEAMAQQKAQNGSSEKTDQIAHAMNAAGITTTSEATTSTRAHALVNILSQKIRHGGVTTTQNSTGNLTKTTAINAMSLQQALAQILPPPLNQTNTSDNNQQGQNSVTPQVLHIVQGKNASGNQITLVDNSQQSVISGPNTTPVLHIVQNKAAASGPTSNGSPAPQSNTFSGMTLVDAGLQQGGNQLLHIVNTGNQKNNNAGQLLKRVNLLTNLTNVPGSNEQKMVQFVCKSADGKSIQLNAPHQRSMVLRLQPIETPSVQTPKPSDNQDLSPTQNNVNSNKESGSTEIKSRSVYEENYAKFIQNSSNKPVLEKSTSLPKFNQAFGKTVYQDGNQKQNEMNSNNIASVNSSGENSECPPENNSINLDHIGQISSPPLLLRKSPAQTSQAQTNLVQQIKQTIAPMNIQTMHGGVIYTRQIPVNIGGGQTINLITVPSTELIDESGQKQVNQDMEPSIIKIVPQSQGPPNAEVTPGDMNVNDENGQNPPQPQPVLTQMRIKLPMLSKTPQMVSGARVVRPSFFQIQRNVIGGANQPVYQQLVLTAAPPLGQQTIRLPQAQARQIKVPDNQSESQMSSSTLEQLREFDMVLEQVKERSTGAPISNSSGTFKLHAQSADATDSPASASSTPTETTQVLYSIGSAQPLSVAYVNRKPTVTTPTTSTFVRSPDSSGIADSPSSSTSIQLPHTSTTESSSNDAVTQQKPVKISSKSKSRPKSSHHSNSMKINTVPPKTSAQKPLEDEQTTQRILYILAEYKEQVENSPDKDKPAPRRRSNPPTNPSGSSKKKKSSSSSRRPGGRDMSPIHGDETCRTMGSEDSSCGTSQGDCNESCLDSHSPQDSPRKVVRKLTFEQDPPISQPRPQQPQRNVIVADGQTITVARGTAGKPATAVLMPANYILPVSMVKGGQQIAIVTNRGPKLLTVGGGEGGATNALLLQRLIGPAGLKPVLARPGVRHVRLPTAALHNLQAFNLATATTVQPPGSSASPASEPTPPELIDTRAESSPWTDRSGTAKPDRASSPDESEPWNLPSSADPHDYSYEETVRTDNLDRTVLDQIQDRYSPDSEAQRIFDKMFDVDSKKSYIDSPRCGYDIDASDCDDKAYQVVQKKDGGSQRQTRLAHVSAAALRHKYAILEHELRLQKSLSEECEDLGVDSPSASELFPEAELLFAASPAQDHPEPAAHTSHTPQPTLTNQSAIQPDIDDQIATDQLLPRDDIQGQGLEGQLGLEDVGIVTVSEDGRQATIALDQEEFARSHPNTTFHSEPPAITEVQPFTISGLKSRHITQTIFHSNRAPATVLMATPQTTVISQAAPENPNTVKYADIDNMINSLPSTHSNNINLSSVLVKDEGLTRFDSILTDSRELHLSNTASAIVHSTGNATQVIRRVCYEDDKRERERFLMDEPDAIIAGDDAKMVAEDSSRDATLCGDVDDGNSSPERHAELFWESNSASERSESRRPLDFSSDSEKCCKSPSYDETNSTDSSGVGTHMRLDSVIKEARGVERSASAEGSSADDTHPPLRTYPPKRLYHTMEGEMERSLSGKTRAGERSPDGEVRRRASGRGVVKRGCHCCNGSPAPPRPKKPRQRKPTMDFTN